MDSILPIVVGALPLGLVVVDEQASVQYVNSYLRERLNLPDETSITLVGDKSSVKLPELMIFDGANTEKRDADRYKNPYSNESFFGHFRLFDRLADYYMGKGDIPIKPEETLGVTAIIDLFYRSAKESREVKMEELEAL